MEIVEMISELRRQLKNVEEVIGMIEGLGRVNFQETLPRQAGRKSMGPKERQQVSDRMRKYWEERRSSLKQVG